MSKIKFFDAHRLLKLTQRFILLTAFLVPSFSMARVYLGFGSSLNTFVGSNNTDTRIDLSSGGTGSGADYIELINRNFSHDIAPAFYAIIGARRVFRSRYYSALEAFADYNPNRISGDLDLLERDDNNLTYKVFNIVSLKKKGPSFGANFIQSIFFSKAFIVYALAGIEHTNFSLNLETDYSSSGSDFGRIMLTKIFGRFGYNIGLGITRAFGSVLNVRAEYVYTRYRDLNLVAEASIAGAQAGDTLMANSAVNPSSQSVRLMLIYHL